jgi:hypothetical protein
MPARARQPSSPPPADEEEAHQVLTRVQQTTLSRRKTIAVDVPFQSPQSSGQASKAAPRQSLPSHAVNDLLSTPRSSQSLAQIRNSSQDLTPKRAAFLGSTVEKRFEALGEYAGSILNFYQDYANRLTLPGLHLADAMDQQLDRYWNMFHSSRKNQVFPSKSNEDDFLESSVVLQANTIDPDSELAIEIIDKITTANRATFVHYVAQLPFRLPSSTLSPETQPWSVNKLVEYLSQGKHERWPMRNVDELLLARKEFFKKIVPSRRKVLVTLDDLHLFLICALKLQSTTCGNSAPPKAQQSDKRRSMGRSGTSFRRLLLSMHLALPVRMTPKMKMAPLELSSRIHMKRCRLIASGG